MNQKHLAAVLIGALVAIGAPVVASTVVGIGTSADSVNKSLEVQSGTTVKDVETVNGSIVVSNGAVAETVETVNGSIRVGDDVSVDSLESVNGSIVAGGQLKVKEGIETVNGRIDIGPGSSVGGKVETVNGHVNLEQVTVGAGVETVNGGIALKASRVAGDVSMANGRIELADASVVGGDIVVQKPKSSGWNWGAKPKPPIVVIGENSEVRGEIRIENEATKLYVHENARIGKVTGATAQRFSAEAPE